MARVTLKTIADEVGVSRTTVSNAFSRPDQLNPELRRRILDTAERMGYAGPDPAARTLRRGRAGVLGVVLTEEISYAFTDPYATAFLRGLAEVAEPSSTSLLLMTWPDDASADASVREAIVDGFVAFCLYEGHPALEALRQRRLPYVIAGEPRIEGVPFVGIDDRAAARRLASYLLSLGHRRLGVIHHGFADPDLDAAGTSGAVAARLAGFREAAAEFGVDWADVPVVRTLHSRDGGHAAAQELLALDPRPTAILATTDLMALGALRAADEAGLTVPADLSVTGFDDIPGAADAGLTTIRQPKTEKGRAVGRLLLDPPQPEAPSILMGHELIIRDSTSLPHDL
ncbi:LacI family DNA-binding transcriptional regulator [Actinocorallia sp. A-T 12471]|uniref:LacI family DNA-binding transcriptional regulator n=1 Tax=Actinocorallia sp. A-T 12471 TaxID=3089813 RepID=UPI0029CE6E02|nr:LacI family DNA-binding transcriptional regulator [Actinocorallia sp. A-T 12471]MDX6740483.1 LacI family DNA-binding transcriptional regulator [Actinocorallia sp. A-T 12471]